jgi:hypothetical protein
LLPIAVAVIGILGVMVGGVATYLGNRELQDEQAERAEENAEAVVKGTARVLQGILRSGDDGFGRSIQDCRYRLYNLETRLPLEDRKRLASELGAEDWEAVTVGMESMRLQYERSLESHTFVFGDVTQIRDKRRKMFLAQKALEEVAETPARRPLRAETGARCSGR